MLVKYSAYGLVGVHTNDVSHWQFICRKFRCALAPDGNMIVDIGAEA